MKEKAHQQKRSGVEMMVETQLISCEKGLSLIATNVGQRAHSNASLLPFVDPEQPVTFIKAEIAEEDPVNGHNFNPIVNNVIRDPYENVNNFAFNEHNFNPIVNNVIGDSYENINKFAFNEQVKRENREPIAKLLPKEIHVKCEEKDPLTGDHSNNQNCKSLAENEKFEYEQRFTIKREDKDDLRPTGFGTCTEDQAVKFEQSFCDDGDSWHDSTDSSSIKKQGDNVGVGLELKNRNANMLTNSTLQTRLNFKPQTAFEVPVNEQNNFNGNLVVGQKYKSESRSLKIKKIKSSESNTKCRAKLKYESNTLEDVVINHEHIRHDDSVTGLDSTRTFYGSNSKYLQPNYRNAVVASLNATPQTILPSFDRQKVHHKNKLPPEKFLSSRLCYNNFTTSTSLDKHIYNRKMENSYNIFNSGFPQTSNLKKRVRVNTGEKTFTCSNCNKCFSFMYHLNRHMMVHTGEKPYVCNICNKSFSQFCNLKTHVRIHTGERPYVCNICNKSFSHFVSLKLHMRTHVGQNTYTYNT